jgi:pimeloyl-ACP methyl ester carboxylesterase
MSAPDMTRSLKTADDRILTFVEVGDLNGPLLLHNHGGPSSRLEAHLFHAAAAQHGLRLVCIDRPGMGRSSAQKKRTYAGWAKDLVAVADSLGYKTFGVSGWSEGGPWALGAAAFIDPARLQHVTSIAGGSYGALGPNWAAQHLSKADALGGSLAIHCRPAFRLMYALLGMTAVHFPATYLKQLRRAVNDYDQRILADLTIACDFSAASAECFAQGSRGLVDDSMALYHQWEFDIRSVVCPVHFWQGSEDRLVPAVINRTIAEQMPGAIWHEVVGAGHFVSIGEQDIWLSIVAQELKGTSLLLPRSNSA